MDHLSSYWLPGLLPALPSPPQPLVLIALAATLMVVVPVLVQISKSQPLRNSLAYAVCTCLLLLSGCGTAPSQPSSCPPVPAHLTTPPAQPVLLMPASASKTPGTTTPSTP